MAGIIATWIPRNWVNRMMGGDWAASSAHHALSAAHWASAIFLAAMMAYNLARPLQMGHKHG